MRSSKVVPADAAPAEPIAESKLPRAPLLRRLVEIEQTIANIKAPDTMDGYKTMPLHTAARRGDMREVAALLPTHHASLTQRDEAGWYPVHQACTSGRRCIFRVPLHQAKMVDLGEILDQLNGPQIQKVRCARFDGSELILHMPDTPPCLQCHLVSRC